MTALKITSFNTGRQYTAHGQRIAYAPVEQRDGLTLVAFNDVDRMISGKVLVPVVDNAAVLAAYDAGDYTSHGYVEQTLRDKLAAVVVKAPKPAKKSAAKAAVSPINRFSVTVWRDDVELAAKDMVTASARVLALVVAAKGVVEGETVRDALQHAFGEAYADLHGCTLAEALTAKSVKNRIADAMAVFKAEVMPTALPSNLQHAAAECRKLNKKAKPEAANDEEENQSSDAEDQERHEPEGLGLSQPVDVTATALRTMQTLINVLREQTKGAVIASLLDDLGDLVNEIGNELDASE